MSLFMLTNYNKKIECKKAFTHTRLRKNMNFHKLFSKKMLLRINQIFSAVFSKRKTERSWNDRYIVPIWTQLDIYGHFWRQEKWALLKTSKENDSTLEKRNEIYHTVVIATEKLSNSEAKTRCYDNFEGDNIRVLFF